MGWLVSCMRPMNRGHVSVIKPVTVLKRQAEKTGRKVEAPTEEVIRLSVKVSSAYDLRWMAE